MIKRVLMGFILGVIAAPVVFAQDGSRLHVTILTASNEGNDFNLVNDEHRDQLLELFSYTSYHQENESIVELSSAPATTALPGGYELILSHQGMEGNKTLIKAIIQKGATQHVDTVLSVTNPGVVFLGGPPINGKVLIIVLEMGF